MTIRWEYRSACVASASPYRVVSEPGGEIAWVNQFLDHQRLRGLAELTLRTYATLLVHFLRWWSQTGVDVTKLAVGNFTEATLLDYIRAQRGQVRGPSMETINQRTTMLRRLFQFHYHEAMPHAPARLHRSWYRPPGLGYRPRRWAAEANLRLRVPPRVIEPLSREQVQRFWSSFRTARDIAIVALLLLNGLRSCEVRSPRCARRYRCGQRELHQSPLRPPWVCAQPALRGLESGIAAEPGPYQQYAVATNLSVPEQNPPRSARAPASRGESVPSVKPPRYPATLAGCVRRFRSSSGCDR